MSLSLREPKQQDVLQPYVFQDQWGRPYDVIVDTMCKPRLAPANNPTPKDWTAPVMPPEDLIRPDLDQLGRLKVLTAEWVERARESERLFNENRQQVAEQLFGAKWADAVQNNDPRLDAAIGTPPESSVFARAAHAGNRWVLGLDPLDQIPSWAEPYLHTLPRYRKAIVVPSDALSAFPSYAEERAQQQAAGVETPVGVAIDADEDDEAAAELAMFGGVSTSKARTRSGRAAA